MLATRDGAAVGSAGVLAHVIRQTWVGRPMRHLLAALLVLLTFGCSVLDSGDRDELRHQIGAMPSDKISFMTKVAMNAKALNWLRHRPPNDQMGKLQCRLQAGGQWSGWNDQEPTYTVAEMIECLL